ncbi:CAP domain-containing protein [Paracoccus lutimaris]|uniref:CAP domain-containing protein n=1 Tax=Paracoccus lutimaris TaxID=1490030 RepID=UPI001FE76491|nr:CAP domain-containing protein [Paracoccus lutimaris]
MFAFSGLLAMPVAAVDVKISTKSPSLGPVTCYNTSRHENEAAVRATNATRKQRGLKPLRANADLALAAARHACDMAQRSVVSHRGVGTRGPMQRVKKTGYKPRLTAENIAAGPWGQERVLVEWERSSGHLANILIPQIQHYGIGKAIAADGKTVFWAAVYSAPKRR